MALLYLLIRPPILFEDSRMKTFLTPASKSAAADARPEAPAPTTATEIFFTSIARGCELLRQQEADCNCKQW